MAVIRRATTDFRLIYNRTLGRNDDGTFLVCITVIFMDTTSLENEIKVY